MNGGLLTEFAAIYRASVRNTKGETELGRNRWGYYGRGAKAYEENLHPLSPMGIDSLLQEKAHLGLRSAMDVFGEGQVLRDLVLPASGLGFRHQLLGGAAVTLTDLRTQEQKAFDRCHNIHLIAGNAWRGSVWRQVRSLMGAIPTADRGFGLIFFLPVGGLNVYRHGQSLKPSFEAMAMLINKMWSCLSFKGGTLLARLPLWKDGDHSDLVYGWKIQNWERKIKGQGIRVVTGKEEDLPCGFKNLLRLDRDIRSPERIFDY